MYVIEQQDISYRCESRETKLLSTSTLSEVRISVIVQN